MVVAVVAVLVGGRHVLVLVPGAPMVLVVLVVAQVFVVVSLF